MIIELASDRVLRPVRESDLDEVFALVVANRDHLARWMPWADDPQRAETATWLSDSLAQAARDDGFQAVILEKDRIVGVAGFHYIKRRDRATSIGYWLAAAAQGRGTMTLAVRALLKHAFTEWDLHRVEIRAAPSNRRSRAIPERLGFVEEGVLRGAERFADETYHDLVVYSMLAPEWHARG